VAKREAIRIVRAAMQQFVAESIQNQDLDIDSEFDSSGLTVDDVFFANVTRVPEGLLCIADKLRSTYDLYGSQGDEGMMYALPAAIGIAELLLSYGLATLLKVPRTCSAGAAAVRVSLLCNDTVRKAISMVLDVIRTCRVREVDYYEWGFKAERDGGMITCVVM